MDSLPLTLDELKRLVSLFDHHRLTELELHESGIRVRLKAASSRKAERKLETRTFDNIIVDEFEGAAAHGPTPEEQGWIAITAPMNGTFYNTPGPDEPAFVEVGDRIELDHVIGLIEAMKIYSEIRSEVAGLLAELPVINGQMVQPGQVLAWILPD